MSHRYLMKKPQEDFLYLLDRNFLMGDPIFLLASQKTRPDNHIESSSEKTVKYEVPTTQTKPLRGGASHETIWWN